VKDRNWCLKKKIFNSNLHQSIYKFNNGKQNGIFENRKKKVEVDNLKLIVE
jgi:hypothetical protein